MMTEFSMVTSLLKGEFRWFLSLLTWMEGDATAEALSEDDRSTIMWTDLEVVRSLVLKPVT